MRPTRTSGPRVRFGGVAVASALVAGGLALVLAGCVPDAGAPAGTPTPSRPSAAASGSAAPDPSPSATTDPRSSIPVDIACSTLVSNDTVYQYGPIYSAKSPFTPPEASAAAQARADRGTTCEWINTSSGTTIDVSVARYRVATLGEQKAASAAGATTVSQWGGDAGFFRAQDGTGVATAFVGDYWIVASSVEFGAAADADPFVRSAVAAVRSR
ncbi:MAG: hypothetical protein HY996_06135 [Micrococcales bacterium]|nr:hypothetical protein [Micrococcales bacterium]